MNVTTNKRLIISLNVFLVCLIASAATPVVFAVEPYVVEEEPYWGTLKVGDEMQWHWSSPSPMVLYPYGYYELKILEIRGERLKAYHNLTGVWYDGNTWRMRILKCGIATFTSDDLWPYIYPAALIQENEDIKIQTYEYNGHTYIGAYLKTGTSEYWWDYLTGILFKESPSWKSTLRYTNAHLTLSMITDFSCPDEVVTGQPFTIAVTLENQEYKDVENVTATIDLPSGFSLISGSTETFIGTITAGENTKVSWTAKAAEPGNFSITVSINSANEAPDYRIITLRVKPSFLYSLTHTTYAGLPPFVWIVLMCVGSGIVVLVILKKRGKAKIR